MERAQLREVVPWPEITLVAIGLILIIGLMFRTSSASCHQWKAQLDRVNQAFLASAGAEEHPQPERDVVHEGASLRETARRVLDARPFGCL
jgi:hypothetical protein